MLCRREGIAESWSKEFLKAGKKRLAGDAARAATTDDVKQLRREGATTNEISASEKLEIIRLVEQSHLPERRTLEKLGIPAPPSTAAMIGS